MANTRVNTEHEVIREAENVLFRHLGLAKATRFWLAFTNGAGDYIAIKKNLFADETVNTLYPKIKTQGRKCGK